MKNDPLSVLKEREDAYNEALEMASRAGHDLEVEVYEAERKTTSGYRRTPQVRASLRPPS